MAKSLIRYNKFTEDDDQDIEAKEEDDCNYDADKELPPIPKFRISRKTRATGRKWAVLLGGGVVAVVLISLSVAISAQQITMAQVEKTIDANHFKLLRVIDQVIAGRVDRNIGREIHGLMLSKGFRVCSNHSKSFTDSRGHCYVVKPESLTSEKAQLECSRDGGYLATNITHEFEPALKIWAKGDGGWLGLKQKEGQTNPKEGWEWELPTGNVAVDMGSIPWDDDQPNDHGKDEPCGYVWHKYGNDGWKVHDDGCHGKGRAVCEYPPLPEEHWHREILTRAQEEAESPPVSVPDEFYHAFETSYGGLLPDPWSDEDGWGNQRGCCW